jgi:HPP family protein
MQVAKFLGLTKKSESELADAFILVANKHENNAEIRDMCKQFGKWSHSNLDALAPLLQRIGDEPADAPERLRSALFHGFGVGGVGLLRDLQDLSLLGRQTHLNWIALLQCAKELPDSEMESVCTQAKEVNEKQLAWLETQIKTTAPQALMVDPDKASGLRASIPKTPTPAALPEIIWAPFGGAVIMLAVGVSAWLAGMPWLIPSLGPTAYLQCENPAHPSARFYNTVLGHAIGLVVGIFAVAILRAHEAPSLLIDHQIVLARVWAAAISLALTILIGLALKASHPPAAATTLLVALGALKTNNDFINAAIGILVVGVFGEVVRRVRLKTATAKSG